MFLIAVGLAFTPATLDAVSDARQAAGLDTIRVGRIILEGNTVVADRVILNQLGIRSGQRLNYVRLKIGQQVLSEPGLFDEPPVVEVLVAEADELHRDIRVRVKETRTGGFWSGANVPRADK